MNLISHLLLYVIYLLVCIILEGMHNENKKYYENHQWLMALLVSCTVAVTKIFFSPFQSRVFASFSYSSKYSDLFLVGDSFISKEEFSSKKF